MTSITVQLYYYFKDTELLQVWLSDANITENIICAVYVEPLVIILHSVV